MPVSQGLACGNLMVFVPSWLFRPESLTELVMQIRSTVEGGIASDRYNIDPPTFNINFN